MNEEDHILYIENSLQLEQLCAALEGAEWIALDTEFLRDRTYYPRFCLLQLATTDIVACVDPIRLPTLDPLLNILFNDRVTKVVHAGRQDLEIFWRLRGNVPYPVFDTQIAAPLLGMTEQISYAGLVAHVLAIDLDKSHCRTDWAARPLTEEQLRYAADDVVYLAKVYLYLHESLRARGRLPWLEADFAALVAPSLYVADTGQIWRKINKSFRLRGAALSVLQALVIWREQTAQLEDQPRNWLMKDEVLVELARAAPVDVDDLRTVRGLQERLARKHGSRLCQIIRDASEREPLNADESFKRNDRDPSQEALLDLLSAVVRLRAEEHDLNPAVLATRKDLEHLVSGDENARLLNGWRHNLVGHDLERLLKGQATLSVEQGKLRMSL